MRLTAILLAGALLGCTSGDITVPSDPVLTQVSPSPSASSAGGGDFVSTIDGALAAPQPTTPLDADTLNLTLYTIEQQKIDARRAEQELAQARAQLVVVQPDRTSVPRGTEGVNIALFAKQTTNAVGERIYPRNFASRGVGACGRFPSADEAQRAFLAAGGPQSDPRGLDPDGDGFACSWDPGPYRQLRL